MHRQWEEQIPYYVNRTRPEADRTAFERHLAGCKSCQQALEDWYRLAGVVHTEADHWAREAPPITAETRARLAAPRPAAAHHQGPHAGMPPTAFPVHPRRRAPRRRKGRAPECPAGRCKQ